MRYYRMNKSAGSMILGEVKTNQQGKQTTPGNSNISSKAKLREGQTLPTWMIFLRKSSIRPTLEEVKINTLEEIDITIEGAWMPIWTSYSNSLISFLRNNWIIANHVIIKGSSKKIVKIHIQGKLIIQKIFLEMCTKTNIDQRNKIVIRIPGHMNANNKPEVNSIILKNKWTILWTDKLKIIIINQRNKKLDKTSFKITTWYFTSTLFYFRNPF